MATYYRWEKSNINYELNLLGKINGTGLGQFTGDTVTIYFGTGYEIAPDGSGVKLGGTVKSYDIPVSEIGDENNTLQDITGVYASRYINSTLEYQSSIESAWTSNVYLEFLGSGDNLYLRSVHGELINRYNIISSKGDFVEYVYSTSPSAYPNGGVSGNYYYDQRTTVTSPTAPTGLTYPNPITTQTVTVSWNAATSNVPDYPVDHYSVMWGVNNNPTGHNYKKDVTGTSTQIDIPTDAQIIQFFVRAIDSNGQRSLVAEGVDVPVYLAPTLTVPSQVMQGQQVTINWTAISAADSYTVQRKANTDTDWTQVYSGTALTFSETAGTWTSVQYRVQAVFSGTPGGWAESAAIPVVSSSALVISGTDGDLGTVVNDIPYSISTDTGNQITATITVNSAVIFSGNVGNSTSDVIPVLDLVNGEGTIVIEASVTASGGPVSAVRTWTYTKAATTFPNAGSVAQLTQEGSNIFPKTLAECVRLPGGGTLDQVMGFPAQVYTASYTGTGTYGASNPTQISFPFVPDLWGIVTTGGQGPANLFPWGTTSIYGWTNTGYINATCSYSDKTVSISGASAVAQANSSNLEHCFIGIKVGTEAEE